MNYERRDRGKQEFIAQERAKLERPHARAQQVLEKNKIDMNNKRFISLLGEEEVARDQETVKETEKDIIRNRTEQDILNKERADIFEAIVLEKIKEWLSKLGIKGEVFKTASFDDLKNGTDILVRILEKEGTTNLGLATDVTFGSSDKFDKKIERLEDEIKLDKLTQIKYSPEGKLEHVPRVIIGVDSKMLDQLTKLWMKGEDKDSLLVKFQAMILEEIRIQLEAFKQYAAREGQKRAKEIYDQTLQTINKIIKETNLPIPPLKQLKEDRVFLSIIGAMKYTFHYDVEKERTTFGVAA